MPLAHGRCRSTVVLQQLVASRAGKSYGCSELSGSTDGHALDRLCYATTDLAL